MADWQITGAEEMILSANLAKKNEDRLKWRVEEDPSTHRSRSRSGARSSNTIYQEDPFSVALNPMEIRTFVLTVKKVSGRF